MTGLLASTLAASCAETSLDPSTIEPHVLRPDGDGALTGPSSDAPEAILGRFLALSRGRDLAPSLRIVADRVRDDGIRVVRMEQFTPDGLRVHGAYAKALLEGDGRLTHAIDALVDADSELIPTDLDESVALAAAMGHLGLDSIVEPSPRTRRGGVLEFSREDGFFAAPHVERVAIPTEGGQLLEGFLVETWTAADNLLDHTLVDHLGSVVSVELRTAADSYNVFAIDPGKSPQLVVTNPATAASPDGWLSGAQTTFAITGNNTKTYLDTDANNAADSGGTAVTTQAFEASANLTLEPGTSTNKPVAVQNLFYLTNRTHDLLYAAGFTEGALNFQTNNFGNGGSGNDPVLAEAQDGSGTNNANFATPSDGSSPRMQMYLWTPGTTHAVVVGGTTYAAMGAAFGPALTEAGSSFVLASVNDGGGASLADGCEAYPTGSLSNKVAIIDRGTCDFVVKVTNAQTAGAKAVIVVNHEGDALMQMGGTTRKVTIPSVFVGKTDGAALRALLGSSALLKKLPARPMNDASLDSDVVYHEYGHGLTWRMIGSMSGKLAGAIGEGASDGLALILNGDDAVGEYSASVPAGIRRNRYEGYPRTYINVLGASVHDDGEIYAAAIWELRKNLLALGWTTDQILSLYVRGMDTVPSTPDFEAMRNGLLDAAADDADCSVWRAFAKFGVGVGADGYVSTRGKVIVTQSFAVPTGCTL